jgi:hypothetical protein
MFSSIHSSFLGKPNCANSKEYSPSIVNTMDVSFRPVKNTSGTSNYLAIIENDYDDQTEIPEDIEIEETIYYGDTSNDDKNKNNKSKDIFSIDNDNIKTFYIGSLTVVGLYILFRILDKTK